SISSYQSTNDEKFSTAMNNPAMGKNNVSIAQPQDSAQRKVKNTTAMQDKPCAIAKIFKEIVETTKT
ncbi:MAG: hypothetical protein AABZ14_00465, partial [Candidatus Margulisiibacteriota bacterium]